jgi:hypothetical protein
MQRQPGERIGPPPPPPANEDIQRVIQEAEAHAFEERQQQDAIEAEIQEIIETRRREREARMRERRENPREAASLAIEDARANLRVLGELRKTVLQAQKDASVGNEELLNYLEEQHGDEAEEERLEMLELSADRIYTAAERDPEGVRFMERDPREALLEATDAYQNAENVVLILEDLKEYFVLRREWIEDNEDEHIETMDELEQQITNELNQAQERYNRAAIDKNDALLEYLIDPIEAERIERDIAEDMLIARHPRGERDQIRAIIDARRMQDPQFVRRQAEQEAIRQADPDIHVQANILEPKMQDMINKIIQILGGERTYDKRTIANDFCDKLNNIVNANAGYDQPEKEKLLRELTDVCNKLLLGRLGDSFSQEKINFMGYSIDYVMLQDELFQKLYADIFTNESRYAYPECEGVNAMSCIAGMVERSYVFLPRVISLRLSMDNEETPLSSEKKQEYTNLAGAPINFNIDFLLEHAREWAKGDMPETIEARKTSLGAYLTNKMTSHAYELGIRIGNTERDLINNFLENAFFEDGSPQFGGRKRRIAKTRRKQRKTQRQARKQRKTQRNARKQRKTQRQARKQTKRNNRR